MTWYLIVCAFALPHHRGDTGRYPFGTATGDRSFSILSRWASRRMQMQTDYSIYYTRFHDESAEHAEQMARYHWSIIADAIPPDKNARILDIGCGFGFALRALCNAGYSNISGI